MTDDPWNQPDGAPHPAITAALDELVAPAAATAAPPTGPLPPATPGPDGRVPGIDGMLDQVAAALARQARAELLPALQGDHELQRRIGEAAGRAAASRLVGALAVGAATGAALGALVGALPAVGGGAVVAAVWAARGGQRAPSPPTPPTGDPLLQPRPLQADVRAVVLRAQCQLAALGHYRGPLDGAASAALSDAIDGALGGRRPARDALVVLAVDDAYRAHRGLPPG